jgi:hypothetical protein
LSSNKGASREFPAKSIWCDLLAANSEQAVMALFAKPVTFAGLGLLLVAASMIVGNAAAQTPTAIAAPDEATVVTLHAAGAQIYECKAGSDGERRAAMASPSLYERSARNRFSTHPVLVFGPDDDRQIQDMRRSGAVEASRGKAAPIELSAKMANTLSASNRLHNGLQPARRRHGPHCRRGSDARERTKPEQKSCNN